MTDAEREMYEFLKRLADAYEYNSWELSGVIDRHWKDDAQELVEKYQCFKSFIPENRTAPEAK